VPQTTVTPTPTVTPDPSITPEPVALTSSSLTVNEDSLTGLDPTNGNNTAANILAALNPLDGYTIRLVAPDGSEVTGLVGTGHLVRIMSNETIVRTYTVILYGDVTGDGKINAIDLTMIQRHILKKQSIQDIYVIASDVTRDEKINAIDLTMIQRHILKLKNVAQ
jgi:hypothetical protein